MALVGVELETLVSESDALTTFVSETVANIPDNISAVKCM